LAQTDDLHAGGIDGAGFDTAAPAAAAPTGLKALKAGLSHSLSRWMLPAVQRVARDYVGGESIEDAIAVARRLAEQKLTTSLGFWDTPDYQPTEVRDIYLDSIRALANSGLDSYLSIKPPALRYSTALAEDVAAVAAEHGVRLHCDSHGVETADPSIRFLDHIRTVAPGVPLSITIPGRWPRSPGDAEWAASRGIGVRVVKGEWPDPADPSRDLREGFMAVIEKLAGSRVTVSAASHDVPLAAKALARLKEAGTPAELELLYSMPQEPSLAWAAGAGYTPRIYVPYGRGFIPNALKVVKRRPKLVVHLARHAILGR
jgi:proline dehydrogenase